MLQRTSSRMRLLLGAAGALALVVGVAVSPAQATRPGPNGRIVFHREDANGFTQVWTANPDLTAQRQLTHGDAYSGFATWSPDSTRIAFDSNLADTDPTDDVSFNDVFTMRADGTDVRKLTDSVGFSGDPAYSPDGTLIAFDANRGVVSGDPGWPSQNPDLSVWVIGVDGTAMRRVTTPPAGASDSEPRFSPDGRKIVFTRFQGGSHYWEDGRVVGDTSAMFTVNLDGSGLTRISGWGLKSGQADWSPDGSKIVFEQACCRFGTAGIFTVPATGGAVTAVVNGHGVTGVGNGTAFENRNRNSFSAVQVDGYYDPVWSPDGTQILAGREYLDPSEGFRAGLVVVNADGTGLRWVSPDVDGEHQPDWGTAPLQ